MIFVRPIGSCRLFTPLKRVRGIFGFRLETIRDYGFTHTSSEALQALRFIRGEIDLPSELLPLIARAPDTKGLFADPVTSQPDIYVIEISSVKQMRIGEWNLQLNYLTRHFADFFADSKRKKTYNKLSRPNHLVERNEWLATQPAYLALAREDQELLSAIEIHMQDEDEIIADLEAILERADGTPVVIQTHVDAKSLDGAPLKTRRAVMQTVTNAAGFFELPLFDPSPFMYEVGQNVAMEKQGRDLTHFAPAFAEQLGTALFENYLRPLVRENHEDDTDTSLSEHKDHARLMAQIRRGDAMDAGHEIFERLRQNPHSPEFRRLAGHVMAVMGDYERAFAIFSEIEDAEIADDEDRVARFRCQFALGQQAQALDYGRSLLDAEIESEEILWICAKCADGINTVDASEFWKRLLQRGEREHEAADAILAQLKDAGQVDEMMAWARTIIDQVPDHAGAFVAVWGDCTSRGTVDEMRSLAGLARKIPASVLHDLVCDNVQDGNELAAATLAAELPPVEVGQTAPIAKELAAQWAEIGMARLADGEKDAAAAFIKGAFACHPLLGATKRANRDLTKAVRQQARDFWTARDYESGNELCQFARRCGIDFPERERYLGLSLYRLGEFAEAIAPLARAAQDEDPPTNVLTSLAQAAKRENLVAEEVRAFQRLDDLAMTDERASALREKRLQPALLSAVKVLRRAVKNENFEEAAALAKQLRTNDATAEITRDGIEHVLEALRVRFANIESSDQERACTAAMILELDPVDTASLHYLAEASIRSHDYAGAVLALNVLCGVDNPVAFGTKLISMCQNLAKSGTTMANKAALLEELDPGSK